MYRLLTIFSLIRSMATAEIGLLDGFFDKPVKESSGVFGNSELFPYRYHNDGQDQSSSRSKRKVADTLYWDSPDSLANKWFSSDDKDFCRVAKSVIIVFAVIGFVGLLIFCVCVCKIRFANSYSEINCRSSCSECGKCKS